MFRPAIKTSIPAGYLLVVFLTGLIILVLSVILESKVEKPDYQKMITAARRTLDAQQIIKELCTDRNIEIDPAYDPNLTGLIGEEFTPITTTLGNLTAKQTSLNPDFAAFIVYVLRSQGINAGDQVAIQASASFPALTIAAIIACETIHAEPVISVSLGASSFGANRPELTYLDMESALLASGIIHSKSALITPGGENDNGSSFYDGGNEIVVAAAKRNGYVLFRPADLEESVLIKWELYKREKGARLFINIGGNQASLSDKILASGLIMPGTEADHLVPDRLIARFLTEKIPVLNLLQIRDLALRNGISVSPQPLPEPGKSMIYFEKYLPPGFWLTGLALMILGFGFLAWKRNS